MIINTFVSENSMLVTDAYQFTMAQRYFDLCMNKTAVFEVFARKFPANRKAMVMCGLSDVLSLLVPNRPLFKPEDLIYLGGLGKFSLRFLDYLSDLTANDVQLHAIPEGTVFYENEPILRITAPMIVGQLLETPILNALNFQISAATKAARIMLAASGRSVSDFSARRCQSPDSALRVARASYMVGFGSTSNVEAGKKFDIPISGTIAHSFITAHYNEHAAFVNIVRGPRPVVVLIDTYDVKKAIRRLIALDTGKRVRSVRIDSGDLAILSRYVRRELDKAKRREVGIICSGDLDEYKIAALAGAPIDGFGVGTALGTCNDAPALGVTYKLVNYDGMPRIKTSHGKATMPGPRNVVRGDYDDVIVYDDEESEPGSEFAKLLLIPVLWQWDSAGLAAARAQFRCQNKEYLALDCRKKPRVRISKYLEALTKRCREDIERRNP